MEVGGVARGRVVVAGSGPVAGLRPRGDGPMERRDLCIAHVSAQAGLEELADERVVAMPCPMGRLTPRQQAESLRLGDV